MKLPKLFMNNFFPNLKRALLKQCIDIRLDWRLTIKMYLKYLVFITNHKGKPIKMCPKCSVFLANCRGKSIKMCPKCSVFLANHRGKSLNWVRHDGKVEHKIDEQFNSWKEAGPCQVNFKVIMNYLFHLY